jgi:hypothetical protein
VTNAQMIAFIDAWLATRDHDYDTATAELAAAEPAPA